MERAKVFLRKLTSIKMGYITWTLPNKLLGDYITYPISLKANSRGIDADLGIANGEKMTTHRPPFWTSDMLPGGLDLVQPVQYKAPPRLPGHSLSFYCRSSINKGHLFPVPKFILESLSFSCVSSLLQSGKHHQTHSSCTTDCLLGGIESKAMFYASLLSRANILCLFT